MLRFFTPRLRTGLLFMLFGLFVLPSHSATAASRFAELLPLVERLKVSAALPSGTAIAVVQEGRIVHQAYIGFADMAQRRPVSADTVFYIASATKPLFALSLLQKETRGELTLNQSLASAFPDIRFAGIASEQIRLRDLLIHGAGIDNGPLVWASAFTGLHDAAVRQRLVAETSAHAKAAYGQFAYSNVGYNLLSIWLEAKHQQTWQQLLQQEVFVPLGMRRSAASVTTATANGWSLALPYSGLSSDNLQALALRKSDQTLHAAGGVLSTAPDLARFLIAQLEQGRLDGKAVLPAEVVARAQQRQITTDSAYGDFKRDGYAFGWYTGPYKGEAMLHHFGAYAGFHAHLSLIPAKRIGLVVLNNEDVLSSELTALIADYVYGELLAEPNRTEAIGTRAQRLVDKAAGLKPMVAAQQQKLQARPWRLSLPANEYVGNYQHELMGTIAVSTTEKGGLFLKWGGVAATATGFDQPETMRVEFIPNSGQLLEFVLAVQQVTALRFDGMSFIKQPASLL